MRSKRSETPSISTEPSGLDLGDARRNARARGMAEAIAREPSLSLPKVFSDGAALEGTYRLLGNENVSFEDLLTPHVEQTLDRVQRATKMALQTASTPTAMTS